MIDTEMAKLDRISESLRKSRDTAMQLEAIIHKKKMEHLLARVQEEFDAEMLATLQRFRWPAPAQNSNH